MNGSAGERRLLRWGIPAALLVLAFTFHALGMPHKSGDFIGPLRSWVEHIRSLGLGQAYGQKFSEYTPLYLYLLGIANVFFPDIPPLYLIKGVSLAANGLAAYVIFRLLRGVWGEASLIPLYAALAVLALPTVVVNAAVIGQCDMYYTAFLLASA
ncbi:MAG: hypothetical protein K2Q01_00325, partial [Rickettsiales bacterium]|nr:hypothetical protein [Rickettsiales bacterium]